VEQPLVFHPNRITSVLTLCFCALLCSCVGATRLPVRATGPAGALQPRAIDLNFVQTGFTQREEVAHQLAAVDTTYSNPRLFWARWSESRWGYWWVVGMPCNSCIAGDAHRKWHFKNFLVAFDENDWPPPPTQSLTTNFSGERCIRACCRRNRLLWIFRSPSESLSLLLIRMRFCSAKIKWSSSDWIRQVPTFRCRFAT